MNPNDRRARLYELAALFLRLGFTSFGGPVAHIALMEREIVTQRGWLDHQHFLDLIGATNLIPGPNSTELAIHIGERRAGWPGLLVAGAAFILPAVGIVLAIAMLYARFGQLPQARALLYGVQPVIIAIVAVALWKFAATALKGIFPVSVALGGVFLVGVLHVNEVAVIALAALTGLIAARLTPPAMPKPAEPVEESSIQPPEDTEPTRSAPLFLAVATGAAVTPLAWQLFWIFLKIGSILYGSGYVLLAFLRADLVPHFLSDHQLLDAVAVGQMTPGPVFTTATFIGYQIAGFPGAAAATIGIFLPSFLLVGLLAPVLQKLRQSPRMRHFLDAVNAASLALMAIVTVQLGQKALMPTGTLDIIALFLALASLLLLLRTSLNSAWLIVGGAIIGLLTHLP